MNGPEDCGLLQGDGKGTNAGFVNEWTLEGLAGSNGITLDCTPTPPAPAASCEFIANPVPSCDTLDNPEVLTWQYTGGGCAASDNDQPLDKAICTESGTPVSGNVTLTADDGTILSLVPGQEFDLSRGASKEMTLASGSGSETNIIHTSCSQPLRAGDVYGSLRLVAMDGQRAGTEVNYFYEVFNAGASISGFSLIDDNATPTNGGDDFNPVFTEEQGNGDSLLDTGETWSFEHTSVLLQSTNTLVTNTAYGLGELPLLAGACAAADSATVTVIEPCKVCKGGTTDIIFVYLGDNYR